MTDVAGKEKEKVREKAGWRIKVVHIVAHYQFVTVLSTEIERGVNVIRCTRTELGNL